MSDFVDGQTQQKPMEDGNEDCSSSVSNDFERIPNTPLDGSDEQQQQEDNMNMEELKTPVDSADGIGLEDDQKKASSSRFESDLLFTLFIPNFQQQWKQRGDWGRICGNHAEAGYSRRASG